MKKILLFVAIIAISLNISAQEQMYVWQNGTKTTFAIADVDSVTFTTEEETPPAIGTENGYKWVDLGLSVKWASCNVGAGKPEYYGDYFAWGETQPKGYYDWSNYKWCNGTSDYLTKYCTDSIHGAVDNKTVLEAADDAARANWGGNWRMPTTEEWSELQHNCTWTWTGLNGISGYKVTADNGNSIFLPASGYFIGESVSIGYGVAHYWSNSLRDPIDAYAMSFDGWSIYGGGMNRDAGLTVRPVCIQNTSVSKQMHVWRKGEATSFAIADVDSVTFDNSNSTSQNPSVQNGIGSFSVSATTQVTFSPGNLQYTQSTNTWSFASAQYEIIGTDNVIGGFMTSDPTYGDSRHGGDALADKVDLFGWSTSATYFGVSTSTSNSHYSGSFVDWGTNKIGNDAPNTWRTLTYGEWYYLRYKRTNANDLCGVAQVNGINGLILLPDNWTCPAGVTFKSGFHSSHGMDYYAAHQTFTFEQWPKLESAGAVFLPAAGYRGGTFVDRVPGAGNYWSASTSGDNSNDASNLRVYSNEANMYPHGRYNGHSVRLVKNL